MPVVGMMCPAALKGGVRHSALPVVGPFVRLSRARARKVPPKGLCDSLLRLMLRLARLGLACVLIVVWGGGCSAVRPSKPATAPAVNRPTRYVLANGVPVIIEEHRASDVVALQLWVQGGARDESPSELGLAHYLEHMLFKGTPTRPAGFVEREVEGVGGRINAGTSWDYTFYHTVLPARQAAAGIEMLVDVAVNASLEANLLEAEKQVVLEEMRLNEDTPRRFLVRELFSGAFAGHPYGRPVIGTSG